MLDLDKPRPGDVTGSSRCHASGRSSWEDTQLFSSFRPPVHRASRSQEPSWGTTGKPHRGNQTGAKENPALGKNETKLKTPHIFLEGIRSDGQLAGLADQKVTWEPTKPRPRPNKTSPQEKTKKQHLTFSRGRETKKPCTRKVHKMVNSFGCVLPSLFRAGCFSIWGKATGDPRLKRPVHAEKHRAAARASGIRLRFL